MENKMFCFQCEQTAGCTGCTGQTGVCGKTSDIAGLQDELTGALIGLARVCDGKELSKEIYRLIMEGLFTTLTNVNFNAETIKKQIDAVRNAKNAFTSECKEYDMNELWNAQEDIRSLKSLILFGLRGLAAYAYHADVLGYTDDGVNRFMCEGLSAVGADLDMDQLLPIVLKVGEVNLKCMEMLDRANTKN